MNVTSKFTIAIHILLMICVFDDKQKVTSEFLASSINVNPVIVRQIILDLKKCKIITVKPGVGGAKIIKELQKISFYDVYKAVISQKNNFFKFHKNPNQNCIVGKNIHNVLDNHFVKLENNFETELKKITLDSILKDFEKINNK